VDHEIEDYVDVEGAGGEDGEAMSLKEHGAAKARLDGEDGWVEALQVAGLEDEVALIGKADEVVRVGEVGGEGLFDEEVDAGIKQGGGHGVVMDGGNGNCCGVDFEAGREELFRGGEDRNGVFGGGVGGTGGIWFDGGDQSDAEAGGFKLAIDPEVVAAESAGAGYGDTQNGFASYADSPLPSTALRQRP
jgi:hypothetical protein